MLQTQLHVCNYELKPIVLSRQY